MYSCTSAALTYTKIYSFIPVYILKVFTEGFVHMSFSWVYYCILCICVCRFSITIHIYKSFFSASAARKYTKIYSLIHIYILKVLLRGLFICHSPEFIMHIYIFASVDFSNIHIYKSFLYHFRCTYIHQHLQFYSCLYSEGFYWGVCSYIIQTYF